MADIRGWFIDRGAGQPDDGDVAKGSDEARDSRAWWCADHRTPLEFDRLYRTCHGTVLYRQDCGIEGCGSVSCCYSTGPDSFIYFLPGELEFQRAQNPRIPFQSVDEHREDRVHCTGNADCIYPKRPLDCRSYPYFPAVMEGGWVGYFDCRSSHGCPLEPEEELRAHLTQIHQWWGRLLRRRDVFTWAEEIGKGLRGTLIVGFPK